MEGKLLFRSLGAAAFLMLITFTTGCISWKPGWTMIEKPSMKGDVKALLAKADTQIRQADTKEKVEQLIRTYETVIKIDPMNYEALWNLGRYYILMGKAYSTSVKEKEDYYYKALLSCEKAMCTNRDFRNLVEKGAKVWDAYHVLTEKEMAAMNYWFTAISSIYSECLSPIGKVLNIHLSGKVKRISEHMFKINPEWEGGHPLCLKANYYAFMPSVFGGDYKKAADYYEKAIKAGPGWLYIKWARAIVLYRKIGDREAFKKDLEWVIAQDPHKADSPYPWNVFFQRDAREMLAHIDEYF